MRVKIKMNQSALRNLSKAQVTALEQTAEAVKTDAISRGIIPFDTGTMQNESLSIDASKSKRGKLTISVDTPCARKLYFHPEYNFKHDKNANAQGRWWDDYIDGAKKDFAAKAYMKLYKRLTGV